MSYVDPEVETPEPTVPSGPSETELALQRENAILKALPGVDLSTPLGSMFTDSYKGELTKEQITARAQEIGLLTSPAAANTPPEEPETPPTKEALTLQEVRDNIGATNGGVIPPASAEEIEAARLPSEIGFERMRESMRAGRPREDAAAEWINRQVAAAASGDERAQWTGWKPDQLLGHR